MEATEVEEVWHTDHVSSGYSVFKDPWPFGERYTVTNLHDAVRLQKLLNAKEAHDKLCPLEVSVA